MELKQNRTFPAEAVRKSSFGTAALRDLSRNKLIYIMLIPVVLYYAVFHYAPMYGVQIAFKNFSPGDGIWGSPWVGIEHFQEFFSSFYFGRIVKNTLLLSFYEVLFAFPAPIILALLLNEVRHSSFKRVVQSITYMPHFISVVVIVGMMVDFLSTDGFINNILEWAGMEAIPFLREASWFRTIFVGSEVWQSVGWGSIVYLAAMSNIDPSLYEAARVDGAGRWKQTLNITLPGIMPTVVIFFILRMGSIMSVGTEKVLLMYNPSTYATADVIGTFIYRKGILEASFSYSAAVGLFNSIINFTLLVLTNTVAKKLGDTKLW